MYSFASVQWAWESLWAAVHERVPWTPAALTWSGDAHARWADDDCLVTQVCGGPFVARHRDDLTILGAFALDLPDADDAGHYHAVLLSPHDRSLSELDLPSCHAAANSEDSLTGWSSLRAATVGVGARWPGTVTFTGAHHNSVRQLARGVADLASIDPWSLAFIESEQPELLTDLHRVGTGPRLPTPPIAVRRSMSADQTSELRAAFEDAMSDPATDLARAALHLTGFVPAELQTYLSIAPLTRLG